MGWFTDLFKDVALPPELPEKIAQVETEMDALKTENVILKDDLREAKSQMLMLEKRLSEFEHNPDLDDTDALIVKEIALTSDLTASDLVRRLNLELANVDFRLLRLAELQYLSSWTIGGSERYSVEPK